ncbi:MAG: NAD+ synthase [Deltaproteobacteria bacterium]|nr:NAD+ synthase [Deltaproteobacteria bacterium]MBW1918970.1 NAD+ synthase [Deltaproteobacteria bacterium]MBW1935023.1 NAD+ synthase [Deltaproteobacteria bacterium]MBW1977067.1 NAD+ synthase [Deltaproteobacteria bacterium]MBW2044268.1 NAD+ synthase [Deltaproteobacteria bacterium]
MKIALCQINPIIGDFDYNTDLILNATERAKKLGCNLAVFPELCLLGYPPKDLLEKPAFIRENLDHLEKIATRIKGIHVVCGYVDQNPEHTGKPLVNSVALMADSRIQGKGGKRLLPTYDVFDETRYFEPAKKSLLFDLADKRVGVTICEDIWNVGDIEGIPLYPLDPVSGLSTRGIDILINISSSPYTLNKRLVRQNILSSLSLRYKIPTLYCNQVGGNDDLLFDGASMVVDRRGKLVLLGKEFESDLLVWDSEEEYEELRQPPLPEEASILKGLVTGTRDYVRKCGFQEVLVGLSGGIDSSLVAVIAERAVGAQNVTGVSMPSQYTSQISREDSRLLAERLNIKFVEIPITDIFDCYNRGLAEIFRGFEPDVTEENIQARIRGNILMALSNKFGALVLSTGNKSELAMGYCTLYGDLTGGLAVISDVPKTVCYRLARYVNKDKEIIPERVLTRPPSAELRPGQKDQDTLPPYEILDDILDAAVVKNMGFEEIVARGHDPRVVEDVLRRLVLNEYKRRQAPPGLKITTKAFGYGRRYPIARSKKIY